ncbi:MAG: zf-HC2 domain-containing protein [Clostridia bacterium]|nr:zf-HC2 domain-containing protein [Clostridia bacterium]
MKTECGIVVDLLPSYIDGVCSPESVKMIDEHLLECGNCVRQVQVMKQKPVAEAIASDGQKTLRRHRRRNWKRVLAGVLAGILLAAGTLVLAYRFLLPVVYDLLYHGTTAYAVVTIGPSKDYTQEEIEAAVRAVRRQFWRDHHQVLLSITYEQRYSRTWGANPPGDRTKEYDEVIVLYGSIFSSNGGMQPGTIREGWSWYLARAAGSEKWTIIGQGYA